MGVTVLLDRIRRSYNEWWFLPAVMREKLLLLFEAAAAFVQWKTWWKEKINKCIFRFIFYYNFTRSSLRDSLFLLRVMTAGDCTFEEIWYFHIQGRHSYVLMTRAPWEILGKIGLLFKVRYSKIYCKYKHFLFFIFVVWIAPIQDFTFIISQLIFAAAFWCPIY